MGLAARAKPARQLSQFRPRALLAESSALACAAPMGLAARAKPARLASTASKMALHGVGQTLASLAASLSRCCLARMRRYSTGITRTSCAECCFHAERMRQATALCV